MGNKLYEEEDVRGIATAIRNKTGSTGTYTISQMASAIDAIETGSGGGGDVIEEVPPKHINFYDYDGTRVAAWTMDEMRAATELPPNPDRSAEGLVNEGWNWTLEQLKADNIPMEVGQTYITNDEKTWIDVDIEPYTKDTKIGIMINGTALVEWGDGTSSEITGSDYETRLFASHSYANAGRYRIKLSSDNVIMPISGKLENYSPGAYSFFLTNHEPTATETGMSSDMKKITAVRFGKNIAFTNCILYGANRMKTVTLTKKLYDACSEIGISPLIYGMFCDSLIALNIPAVGFRITSNTSGPLYGISSGAMKRLSMPKTMDNSIPQYGFKCELLEFFTPPRGLEISAANYFIMKNSVINKLILMGGTNRVGNFSGASPAKIVLGKNITSITAAAFMNKASVKELVFGYNGIVSLSSSSTFTGVRDDIKIYIPTNFSITSRYPDPSVYTYIRYNPDDFERIALYDEYPEEV